MVAAAAEPTGDAVVVLAGGRPARRRGQGRRHPAIEAGLIEFGGQVRFCHPLARAAVY